MQVPVPRVVVGLEEEVVTAPLVEVEGFTRVVVTALVVVVS
jgi:hypothetical protein